MESKQRTKQDYEIAAKQSYNLSDMCRYFNLNPTSSDTMKHAIAKYKIDVSHFKIPVFLHETHGMPLYPKGRLKKETLEKRGHRCEKCSLSMWNDKPIPLHLDHIDGINTNNKEDNIRLLCHNCHAQTPTFCRNSLRIKDSNKLDNSVYHTKNKLKRALIETNGHICSHCKQSKWLNTYIPIELDHIDGNSKNNEAINLRLLCPNCHSQTDNWGSKNKIKITNPKTICNNCGKNKGYNSDLCQKCHKESMLVRSKIVSNSHKINSKELMAELNIIKGMIIETSYENVGRKYGVTGNAVKSLLKRNGIELPKKIRNSFSEQDDFCKCGNFKKRDSKHCLTCANTAKTKYEYPDDKTLKLMIEKNGISVTYKELNIPRNSFHSYIKVRNII